MSRRQKTGLAVYVQPNALEPDINWPSSRNRGRNIAVWYEPPTARGTHRMLKIVGVTQDKDGNALAACTVQGFRTASDAFVNELVSDAGGYYEFCSQYNEAHYLVAYKTGAPDVTGSSVNTLTPA
jgi:hypothetical protein